MVPRQEGKAAAMQGPGPDRSQSTWFLRPGSPFILCKPGHWVWAMMERTFSEIRASCADHEEISSFSLQAC